MTRPKRNPSAANDNHQTLSEAWMLNYIRTRPFVSAGLWSTIVDNDESDENEGPFLNRLLEADVVMFSEEPLYGVMTLDSDAGTLHFALNRKAAILLRDYLSEFIAGQSPRADAPTPHH